MYTYVFTCCLDKMTNKLTVLFLTLVIPFVMTIFTNRCCLYLVFSVRHCSCVEIQLSTIKDQGVEICE